MKFLKFLAFLVALLIAAVLLWSLGSAFHAGFIQGGLLWRSTPFQLLIESIPYLLGVFIIFAATYAVFHFLFTKTK